MVDPHLASPNVVPSMVDTISGPAGGKALRERTMGKHFVDNLG